MKRIGHFTSKWVLTAPL
ncbi:hypothetical protein MYU51_005615 [Penicillium brevicompactum]